MTSLVETVVHAFEIYWDTVHAVIWRQTKQSDAVRNLSFCISGN